MGTWGYGLYDNDTALDIKDEFEDLIKVGKSSRDITNKLIDDYQSMMGDPDDEPVFWFALADTQCNCGMLLPDVKEKAIDWIKRKETQLNDHNVLINTGFPSRKELEALKAKLLSPQPPAKKTRQKRVYVCQWKMGDVFACRMESELARERGLWGCFLLIQKVDECVRHPGHIVPIIYVKITKEPKLPCDLQEYNQLEFVQTWSSKYEERFWPIDFRRLAEDIAEKSMLRYERDEFGYLPVFRAVLLNTSQKVIPKDLIYLGNYESAKKPEKEFVPHVPINIVNVSWNNHGETFETDMIKRYCRYNLREGSIYKSQTLC